MGEDVDAQNTMSFYEKDKKGVASAAKVLADSAQGNDKVLESNAAQLEEPQVPVNPKKSNKKKKKPKSQRGIGKPTGFEEYHADSPLTLDDYARGRELYDPGLPFFEYDWAIRKLGREANAKSSRILTAIQHFERTRKLHSDRRNIFHKYLAYGGIDAGPNMFQGGQDTESMNKDELAVALSQTHIADDKRDLDPSTRKYVIDFEGCMRGFLSRQAIHINGFETLNQVKLVTSTLERFMDYLLQHDTCPEYKVDITRTRNLCRQATNELWDCVQLSRSLPGDFNTACSIMANSGTAPAGMTVEYATQMLDFGFFHLKSENLGNKLLRQPPENALPLKVVQIKRDIGFEITRIEQPQEEWIEAYNSKKINFKPLGRVYAKLWVLPDAAPVDLTTLEREANIKSNVDRQTNGEAYVFYLEDEIQSKLRVGTKVEATISETHLGVCFLDNFLRIFPSFDLFLANDLMIDYKEPGPMKGPFADEDDELGDNGDDVGVEEFEEEDD